jgi:hypothetical protein
MTRTTNPRQGISKCEHKETLNARMITPDEVQPGDQLIAVLSEYGHTWYAARALTHWDDDYVRDFGDKISEEAANELFPMFQHIGWIYRD